MRQVLLVMLNKNVQLVLGCGPTSGVVKADRSELEQVVLNLVLNARDAMAERRADHRTDGEISLPESARRRQLGHTAGRLRHAWW